MPFNIAVVYYSRHGLLVTLANVIAAGARKVRLVLQHAAWCSAFLFYCLRLFVSQVPGAEVKVYRVRDPVQGDDPTQFEEGVLDAPPITEQVL